MAKKYEIELSKKSKELELNFPVHVLLGEATDIVGFAKKYMDPVTKGPNQRPGLISSKGRVTPALVIEIEELVQLAGAANSEALLSIGGKEGRVVVERAQFIVDEIEAVVDWFLDDGIQDEKDAQFAAVKKQHDKAPDTADALATELQDYVALATPYRDEIDGAIGFDAALLDEGAKLVGKLRALPHQAEDKAERKALYARRNQLINALYDRVRAVRSTAKAAFRHHPEIAQQATSNYGRKTRAQARRAEMRSKNGAAETPQTPAPAPI